MKILVTSEQLEELDDLFDNLHQLLQLLHAVIQQSFEEEPEDNSDD